MNSILHTLVASLRKIALSRENVFVASAGMTSCHHESRPILRWTAVLALAAMALSWDVISRTASASPIVIDGGTSWGGWSLRGNSRDVGIWAKESTTRDFDLYTTVFHFDNNAITGSPVQVKVATAPSGFGQGTYSQGAFANGNVIMGVGLKMKDSNASAIGTTFVNFGIGTNNYQAASSLGGTDGRTGNTVWAHTGDFGMWMSAQTTNGNGPSNLYAMTTNGAAYAGTGQYSNLPGGFGSGVSYDYAARIFRQGGAGGSIQFLFDLTAMESLYGAGSPSLGGGWTPPSSARIGAIDLGDTSNLNLSIYNSNDSFVNASTVVIGPISPIPVPEPSTSVLGVIAIGTLAFAAHRRTRKGHVVH
jgi:hypothetical protein